MKGKSVVTLHPKLFRCFFRNSFCEDLRCFSAEVACKVVLLLEVYLTYWAVSAGI